jgi:hypothetical protein
MAACNDFSAWRGFPKPRVPARRIGRPRKHPEINMFYGRPAVLIATTTTFVIDPAFCCPPLDRQRLSALALAADRRVGAKNENPAAMSGRGPIALGSPLGTSRGPLIHYRFPK